MRFTFSSGAQFQKAGSLRHSEKNVISLGQAIFQSNSGFGSFDGSKTRLKPASRAYWNGSFAPWKAERSARNLFGDEATAASRAATRPLTVAPFPASTPLNSL